MLVAMVVCRGLGCCGCNFAMQCLGGTEERHRSLCFADRINRRDEVDASRGDARVRCRLVIWEMGVN